MSRKNRFSPPTFPVARVGAQRLECSSASCKAGSGSAKIPVSVAFREPQVCTVMPEEKNSDSTKTSVVLENGRPQDRQALDRLFSIAYEELRRLARSVKYSGPKATITPSTLVNEAWIKLAKSSKLTVDSELHFKNIAAQAIYQILVEAARRHAARKRGGGSVFVTFDESMGTGVSCEREVLALHSALEELARMNPRQAALVKSRYFGGLDIAETAAVLGVSEKTVDRDWRAAKAWLASEIRRSAAVT
jgi:RNA polymerase sigma factor (TIGR02999 family)